MEQISFFDNSNRPLPKKALPVVLSASRMTDMPKFYPRELIKEVNKRLAKGIDVHTLVLWSKHPDALISSPLKEFILNLKSKNIPIYFQCTITGMGGTLLEPQAPYYLKALNDLKSVIDIIGDPNRIRLRIDPLIKIIDKKKQ